MKKMYESQVTTALVATRGQSKGPVWLQPLVASALAAAIYAGLIGYAPEGAAAGPDAGQAEIPSVLEFVRQTGWFIKQPARLGPDVNESR